MSHFTPPTIEELQSMIPNYQVHQMIAHGERSAIYSAVHMTLGRNVAIKIIPPHLSQHETTKAGFENSAKALAAVQHPNLVGVYDFGSVNNMLFAVMELVEGKSLFDIAFGQKIAEHDVINIASTLCKGLHQAHLSGILHLGMKPSSVMIGDQGVAKIIDFKNALPAADEVTPYTSPEMINRPDLVDQRADVYAVGVIIYELLTAQYPNEHLVPASTITQVDPRFDGILAKALHPNPEMRYSTAEKLGADLNQLITAPQNPLMTGPVTLATPGVATAPVAQSALNTANPMLTPAGQTAPVTASAPKMVLGGSLNTNTAPVGPQTTAIGQAATPQATSALAGIAGRPTSALAAGSGLAGGAAGLGATGVKPLASSTKGGGSTIWVILGIVAVVGGFLAFAMSGGEEEDDSKGPTADEIARKKNAEKAKARDQREKERLANFKRDKANAIADEKAEREEEKELAKEKKMEAEQAKLKKKFIASWEYEDKGQLFRRNLLANGNATLFKNGKDTGAWKGYKWRLSEDGKTAEIYKPNGDTVAEVVTLPDNKAEVGEGFVATKKDINAKWDKLPEDPKMADNSAKDKKKKDETVKKDAAKPGEELDPLAVIEAEEDVPEMKTDFSKLGDAQFDVKNFVAEQKKEFDKKIDEALGSKTQRIGPLARKLKREMTESIVAWDTGYDGRESMKIITQWLSNCESKSKMLPLPATLSAKAKEVVQKDIEANQFIINDLNQRPLLDFVDLRNEYMNVFYRKAQELRPKNDHGAMARLEAHARNATRSNKAFLKLIKGE